MRCWLSLQWQFSGKQQNYVSKCITCVWRRVSVDRTRSTGSSLLFGDECHFLATVLVIVCRLAETTMTTIEVRVLLVKYGRYSKKRGRWYLVKPLSAHAWYHSNSIACVTAVPWPQNTPWINVVSCSWSGSHISQKPVPLEDSRKRDKDVS